MTPSLDTICALATPRGQGAVGMVRLSGPLALSILRTACGLDELRPRRMVSAWLRQPHHAEVVDQVMVCAMPAPRSYTGEDVAEIFGHGGELNMDRVLALLLTLGARMAEPGEFTRRAFLNGRLDLTQAEAVAQVIAAQSEQAARNAVATLAGALGQRLGQLREQLLEITAHLEARIDFTEELEDAAEDRRLLLVHRQVEGQVNALLESYSEGRRLDGAVVALVGPVNAGKSSLFNGLLDRSRALVSREPGTTRDYLEAEVTWQGRRLVLVDTAGSRCGEAATPLEAAGQELADEVIARCDLLVRVMDLSDPQQVSQPWDTPTAARPVLLAANKLDICPDGALETVGHPRGFHAVVGTSARRGDGMERLRACILGGLFPLAARGQAETVMVTRQRQFLALQAARQALACGARALKEDLPPEIAVEHYREALLALGEITGETYTEDVLDAVFQQFCIGK